MAGCFECFGRRPRAPPPPPPPRPANPPAPPAKHPGGATAYDSDPLRDPHLSSLTDPDPRPASRDLPRADSKKQRRDLKRAFFFQSSLLSLYCSSSLAFALLHQI
jgi:hypothetical protein